MAGKMVAKHGKTEVVRWMGIRFYRWPNSPSPNLRNYFRNGSLYLHQLVWIFTNGQPIPEGHHIHHQDEDTLNNQPANLFAELAETHLRRHGKNDKYLAQRRAALAVAQPLAKAWHSSPEGVEWHRQHGRDVWKDVAPTDKVCIVCGAKFGDRNPRKGNHFCSGKCRTKWRYTNRVDFVDRVCAACGKSFSVNKWSPSTHCSRQCAGASTRRRTAARKAASLQPDGR